MCMQCVAQSTPMVAVGLAVLRRRTLVAWLRSVGARRRPGHEAGSGARRDG